MGYEEPTPENDKKSNKEQEGNAEDVGTGVDDKLEVPQTTKDWEKRFKEAKGPDAWREQE